MNGFSPSPIALAKVLGERWSLILDLTKRDALGRYRNSWLGVLWSLITPIFMLLVYTFVFSSVFKVRWGDGTGSKTEFALILFSGLIVFNIFAECASKAPSLVVSNANMVKKVVFPLEILPVVALLSSLIHAGIAFVVLLSFQFIHSGGPGAPLLLLPLLLAPYCFFVLGVTWFVSSLAVYVRDVSQTIGVVITMLLFLSPIFFPTTALPEEWRVLTRVNPLAGPIEQVRGLVIWGTLPTLSDYAVSVAVGAAVAWLGFAWFQKVRRGFADVL